MLTKRAVLLTNLLTRQAVFRGLTIALVSMVSMVSIHVEIFRAKN